MKLFPTREDADDENNNILSLLPGENLVFKAIDGRQSKYNINKKCLAPKTLLPKETSVVMLLINYPKLGLVNGSIGVVHSFVNNYPHVRFKNGRSLIIREYTWEVDVGQGMKATRRQLPITLGWAVTIHKCQGLTLEKAEISLSNLFVQGKAYVALSRVKTLNGIHVKPGFDTNIPAVSTHVVQMYDECVVPVSTVNCFGLKPIRMTMTADEQINGNAQQATLSKVVSNWKHVLPLPAAVNLRTVMEKVVKDELISNETKSLLSTIGFEREQIPKMLVNFFFYAWMKLDKLIFIPKTDNKLVASKKNWIGYARSLHQFKISNDLSKKWVEVLTSCGVPVINGKLSALQRSVMARLVDVLHTILVGQFP